MIDLIDIAIFALLVLFVAANVWVEARNEADGLTVRDLHGVASVHVPPMHWWNEPLSAYLYGVADAWMQSAAYLGFALAELLLIVAQPHGPWWTMTLALGAAGLIGVVATASLRDVWHSDWRRKLHVVSAGVAFAAALAAQLIALWGTPDVWFPVGAVAIALAFARFAPERHALEEKAFTLALVCGFVSIAGLPL